MGQGGEHHRLRPSPAMIVALIALVVAMSGTAVAATTLVSGDKLIKKQSLSGNRVRNHTLTGTQINLSLLGKVPNAAQADSATSATHASSADSATSATRATIADSATSATHASSADSATNAAHAAAADTATSAAPSGTAGGDLAGAYPNPTIASGAVGTTKLGSLPGARVHGCSDTTVLNNYYTALSFTDADYNIGGVWDGASPDRFNAPVAGEYIITFSVKWDGSTTGFRALMLRTGSGVILAYNSLPGMNDAVYGGVVQEVVTVARLTANQAVQALVWQNTGGSFHVQNVAMYSPVFAMQWVAP